MDTIVLRRQFSFYFNHSFFQSPFVAGHFNPKTPKRQFDNVFISLKRFYIIYDERILRLCNRPVTSEYPTCSPAFYSISPEL